MAVGLVIGVLTTSLYRFGVFLIGKCLGIVSFLIIYLLAMLTLVITLIQWGLCFSYCTVDKIHQLETLLLGPFFLFLTILKEEKKPWGRGCYCPWTLLEENLQKFVLFSSRTVPPCVQLTCPILKYSLKIDSKIDSRWSKFTFEILSPPAYFYPTSVSVVNDLILTVLWFDYFSW